MRWEYLYLSLPHGRTTRDKIAGEDAGHFDQIEAILNELGGKGWELVAVTRRDGIQPASFALKRPVA